MDKRCQIDNFYQLEDHLRKRYKVRIKYKDESVFWRLLPESLQTTGITLKNTIWMPTRDQNFSMLCHEYAHVVDQTETGWLKWILGYLFPQVISLIILPVLIVGIILSNPYISTISLVLLITSLLPWPSKHRLEAETRGYLMNLFLSKHKNGCVLDRDRKNVIDSMFSWTYYKMIWKRSKLEEIVDRLIHSVETKENLELFKEIMFVKEMIDD